MQVDHRKDWRGPSRKDIRADGTSIYRPIGVYQRALSIFLFLFLFVVLSACCAWGSAAAAHEHFVFEDGLDDWVAPLFHRV